MKTKCEKRVQSKRREDCMQTTTAGYWYGGFPQSSVCEGCDKGFVLRSLRGQLMHWIGRHHVGQGEYGDDWMPCERLQVQAKEARIK